jgi:hypothetical protein
MSLEHLSNLFNFFSVVMAGKEHIEGIQYYQLAQLLGIQT